VVTTRITTTGLALLETLDGPVREAVDRMLDHMSATQLTTLIEMLELARERSAAPATPR
jgi:hypothetical protein